MRGYNTHSRPTLQRTRNIRAGLTWLVYRLNVPTKSKSCLYFFSLSAGIGCYGNYPSVLLGSYTNEIDWFARFASQMETIIKKCAELAVKKRYRYFAVEGYGNCYGAQNSPSGGGPKTTRCNFGVGLNNHYYVYEVFL